MLQAAKAVASIRAAGKVTKFRRFIACSPSVARMQRARPASIWTAAQSFCHVRSEPIIRHNNSYNGDIRLPFATQRAYSFSTGTGWAFQIRSQYSRIARSEENLPVRAVFRIDMRVHAWVS